MLIVHIHVHTVDLRRNERQIQKTKIVEPCQETVDKKEFKST